MPSIPTAPTITLKNIDLNNDPADYLPSDGLIKAVEVAYALKRPLLLSGEPGTGKSEFARWVAQALPAGANFGKTPLVFNTKSTSSAQDLFYYYDAVSHFNESKIASKTTIVAAPAGIAGETVATVYPERSTADYIELRALGSAFQNATGKRLLPCSEVLPGKAADKPVGSVVLIDEIDKAPRDFPNDLLNEIERFEFGIKELNLSIRLTDEEKKRILIIMTSNFEKNLPEPFLRRCVYFHIEFPNKEDMSKIVRQRLNIQDNDELQQVSARIDEFFTIRQNDNVQKKPSTSECLDFIRILRDDRKLGAPLFGDNRKASKESEKYLSLLLKKREDRELYV